MCVLLFRRKAGSLGLYNRWTHVRLHTLISTCLLGLPRIWDAGSPCRTLLRAGNRSIDAAPVYFVSAISCGSAIRSPRNAAITAPRKYAFGSTPHNFALSSSE